MSMTEIEGLRRKRNKYWWFLPLMYVVAAITIFHYVVLPFFL